MAEPAETAALDLQTVPTAPARPTAHPDRSSQEDRTADRAKRRGTSVSSPLLEGAPMSREERFHDEWGQSIEPDRVPVIGSFEACTAPENRFIMSWLGDVSGLRVLDLGSGAGEAATYFALRGAEVTAADSSSEMLKVVRLVAARHGVHVTCEKQDANELRMPPRSFDIVYAANLLHHVDLDRCLAEVARVLKPNGRFVSWDPLRHNPAINVYRRMAAAVRTVRERPLSIRHIRVFRRHFRHVEYRCFWLTALWIFMRFFLIERVHPSKQRYWKKVILEALAERLDWSDQTRQLRTQAYLSYWMVKVASQPAEQFQIELLRQALKKGVTIGAVQDWAADELSNRGVADALPKITKSIKDRTSGKWADERIWFCKTRIELLTQRPSRQEALVEALGMKDITQYQDLKQWAIEELGKLDTPESRQGLIGFAIELQTTYRDAMGKRVHGKGDQETTHASSFYHAIIKRLRCNGMSLSDMESAGLKPRKLFFTSGGPAFNESQCCSCP